MVIMLYINCLTYYPILTNVEMCDSYNGIDLIHQYDIACCLTDEC